MTVWLENMLLYRFLHSNYHTHKQKLFFILWQGMKRKHYPMYIISQTKYTTNIFVWGSGLKTWFHTDCHHSNYQMLKVAVTDMRNFATSKFFGSLVHKKNFGMLSCFQVRILILWREVGCLFSFWMNLEESWEQQLLLVNL